MLPFLVASQWPLLNKRQIELPARFVRYLPFSTLARNSAGVSVNARRFAGGGAEAGGLRSVRGGTVSQREGRVALRCHVPRAT